MRAEPGPPEIIGDLQEGGDVLSSPPTSRVSTESNKMLRKYGAI